ncbi:MAG: phenylacetic acid degradation operon negative regulatory protein PaaX, partial [Xanthomonadales bacterium]|nr:phenylacetic acid degradation operon negative regulatory protein PaaX [Xanthomonadales bacterium]
INERLTRTAVFRLAQDGWLESRKQGRRSFYRLTETGQHYYQRAANRIYASQKPAWDGVWTLLFVSLVTEEKRQALHRGLSWLGYGQMAATVYALPRIDRAPLKELLADLGLKDSVVQMQAQAEGVESLQQLVMSRWKLDELRHRYSEFTCLYGKARKMLSGTKEPSAHAIFLLRIMLVHEYRRILLKDPELPAVMLPADWEGHAAQSLCGDIYRQIAIPTNKWVSSTLLNADGNMKGSVVSLRNRFPANPING